VGQFQKGQSGNPGGRPAGTSKLRARIYAKYGEGGEKLIDALGLIGMGTQKAIQKKFGAKAAVKERVAALKELLDRGWGTSVQSIELDGKDGKPIRVVFGGRHRPGDGSTNSTR
jgi:hypothetical protein